MVTSSQYYKRATTACSIPLTVPRPLGVVQSVCDVRKVEPKVL